MPAARSDAAGRRLIRRLAIGTAALLVLAFAVEGGEYGTSDLFSQRGRHAALQTEVEELRAEVDSLQGELKRVQTDDRLLERIAREEYGMVKGPKEILYWTRVDSAPPPANFP